MGCEGIVKIPNSDFNETPCHICRERKVIMVSQAKLAARDPRDPQERQGSPDRRAQLDLTDLMVEMATQERSELTESQ